MPTNGDDLLFGTPGADSIDALAGNDNVSGGAGDDTIDGNAGDDTINGGVGNDSLTGGAGTDVLDFSDATYDVSIRVIQNLAASAFGNDTISGFEAYRGGSGNDSIIGSDDGSFIETISGGAGDDALTGGGGPDILDGGSGSDLMFGSDGIDEVTYVSSLFAVSGSLDITQFFIGPDIDFIYSTEILTGSNFDDTLRGSLNDDVLRGGNGADILRGFEGNDTLQGQDGADSLEGEGGRDSLFGGNGDDSLSGGNVQDTLFGGAGNDILRGDGGADSLLGEGGNDLISEEFTFEFVGNFANGGDGDDTIQLSGGPDTMVGGAGADVFRFVGNHGSDTINDFNPAEGDSLEFQNLLSGLTVESGLDLDGGGVPNDSRLTHSLGTVVILNAGLPYQTIQTGSDLPETLLGGTGSDSISGFGGNDSITGLSGPDLLSGGAGDDTLNGGGDADTLQGGAGNDVATYADAAGAVTVNLQTGAASGAEGADVLTAIETVIGSGFADVLTGDANANRLDGANGDDTLAGGLGADTLIGGAGRDRADYSAMTGAVVVSLATGLSSGAAGADVLSDIEDVRGGSGSDALTGNGDANLLLGENGSDTLEGGLGADTLNGGGGLDTARYTNAAGGVVVDLVTGGATGGDGADVLVDIENVDGSGFADFFVSSTASNRFDGAAGADGVSYAYAAGGVTVNLAAGTATGHGTDTLVSIENVYGGAGGDRLAGSSGANQLYGAGGADTLVADAGDDILDGEGGIDTADYSAATASIVANLAANFASSTQTGLDTLQSIEVLLTGSGADTLVGSAAADRINSGDGADYIAGGAEADTLQGGAGGDQLLGENGDDSLDGGLGSDMINGGAGTDTATWVGLTSNFVGNAAQGVVGNGTDFDIVSDVEIWRFGTGNDIFVSWNGTREVWLGDGNDWVADYSAGNNDVFSGEAGNDALYGLAGDDSLLGGAGNDLVIGGDGFDTLVGGDGFDWMQGGAGADTFVFNALSESTVAAPDAIADFTRTVDRINLSGIDANVNLAGDQAFTVVSAFTNVAGQLRIQGIGAPGNPAIVSGDVDGDGVADFAIYVYLTGGETTMNGGDFIL